MSIADYSSLRIFAKMTQRFFKYDKNYILKEAQKAHKVFLLHYTFKKAIRSYYDYHNPLGLIDDTIQKIMECESPAIENLDYIYDCLAGIYRFKFGQNQLEFLFDGTSHFEKYSEDWKKNYKSWIKEFCLKPTFLKAVLEATVFFPEGKKSELALNRVKAFIDDHFELKVYKHRGIVLRKSA